MSLSETDRQRLRELRLRLESLRQNPSRQHQIEIILNAIIGEWEREVRQLEFEETH